MARTMMLQGYTFFACERCGFAYKDSATADKCARFDLEHGMRSADITGDNIAPPDRYWQAVTKFHDEELKAAKKAAAAAAGPAAAKPGAPAAPSAAPAAAGAAPAAAAATPGPPKFTPEELEARKKAALEKAAAMKAQKAAEQQG